MPDTNSDFHLPAISAAEALARQAEGAILIDLRKTSARDADGRVVLGAVLRDPFTFGHDDPLMTETRPLITFCVHGHEVSQFGCAMLMVHGRDAVYVRGGCLALAAAGAVLRERPE